MLHFLIDGTAYNVFHGFLHFVTVADELALRHLDFGAGLHQGEVLVSFLFGLLVLGPEEFLHFLGYSDGSAIVVDGGVRFGRGEDDTVPGYAGGDGAAQLAGVVQVGGGSVAFLRPWFAEESAALEVAVKLIEQFHLDVAKDLVEHGVVVLTVQKYNTPVDIGANVNNLSICQKKRP